MHIIRPLWLTHGGEKKDFEAYSCHVSPDGSRLVTAAGGASFTWCLLCAWLTSCRWLRSDLVNRSDLQCRRSGVLQTQAVGVHEPSFRHDSYRAVFAKWEIPCVGR